MKTLVALIFGFLLNGQVNALSFNGTTCESINVTPQLVVTCQNGGTVTTTIETPPATPTAPATPPPVTGAPISCTLTGKLTQITYTVAIARLTANCSPSAVGYLWSVSGCSSSSSLCSVTHVPGKAYTVTGTGQNGSTSEASFHF